MTRLACMADHWLFSHLDGAGRSLVVASVQRRQFAAGQTLFRQGDAATMVFLVTRGRIRLYKTLDDGREVVLGYLGPHDLYGEQALFADAPQALSAAWAEDGALCVCEKADFQRLLAEYPDLALAVIKVMGDKLREVTELWASGAGAPVRERVSRTLGQLARKYGEATPRGLRLGFRLTHEELGALVGASRVMVTYALGELRKASLLEEDDAHHFIIAAGLTAQDEPTEAPLTAACPCFSRP